MIENHRRAFKNTEGGTANTEDCQKHIQSSNKNGSAAKNRSWERSFGIVLKSVLKN
jgi:hypothetical protein